MTDLKRWIVLSERYVDRMVELDQWRNDPTIYVSFTTLPKIGINPSSQYHTPIGIYAYPLKEFYRSIEDNVITHAGDAPYIQVLQSDQVTELASYTEADLQRDVAKLKGRFGHDIRLSTDAERKLWDQMGGDDMGGTMPYNDYTRLRQERHVALMTKIQQMQHDGTAFDMMIDVWSEAAEPTRDPAPKMWNITRNIALQASQGRQYAAPFPHPSSVAWAALLRWLGYQAFSDKTGMGLIHENEPISAVFLTKTAFRHLRTIDNVTKLDNPANITRLSTLTELLSARGNDIPNLYSHLKIKPPYDTRYGLAGRLALRRWRALIIKEWPDLLHGSSEHFHVNDTFETSLVEDFPEFMHQLLNRDFRQLPIVAKVLYQNNFFRKASIVRAFIEITPLRKDLPIYLEVMLGKTFMAHEAAHHLADFDHANNVALGKLLDAGPTEQHDMAAAQREVGNDILRRVANIGNRNSINDQQWRRLESMLGDRKGIRT